MSIDKNFGVATPRVRLFFRLPKVVKKTQSYNFDVSAFQWRAINNSQFLSPLLTENVTNPEGTFAVCFPSKRKYFVDNMLFSNAPGIGPGTVSSIGTGSQPQVTSTSPPPKTIFWRPVGLPPPPQVGVINEVVKNLPSYYENIPITDPISRIPRGTSAFFAAQTGSTSSLGEYFGPQWSQERYKEQSQPDDDKIIQNFISFITGNISSGTLNILPVCPNANSSPPEPPLNKFSIYQTVVRDGLWWGIESSNWLDENMPFWVTFEFPTDPPSPAAHQTMLIISLGVNSTANTDRYDLLLVPNEKPVLIDYYGVQAGGAGAGGTGNAIHREFETETSRLIMGNGRLDVGFMTAGGRLIIFVNDNPLVYTRIVKTGSKDEIGKMKEAKIEKGRIKVYGTNIQSDVYAYPMAFAKLSSMAFPISSKKTVDVVGGPPIVTNITYSAADEENLPTGLPVAVMPVPAKVVAKSSKMYGVDAEEFKDSNGTLNITPSFGLHREGKAQFFNATSSSSVALGPLPNLDFFFLLLTPENRSWKGGTVCSSKTPYFFRLKGVDNEARLPGPQTITDVTKDVISIKETASAPDYFHIKRGASITLYNEGGTYDPVKFSQFGIDIAWGWNGNIKQTFTGIVTSSNSNEIPGKETITLNCDDYNYILENTPIINSPYYDGMVGFHAVKDLARRAGIEDITPNWDPIETEFFLPSGYSFSNPKMRFKSTDRIFDCIMNIVKRFEAYIYFDASGRMHVDKLPGGLLGVPPGILLIANQFTSNPLGPGTPILDQKDITIDFNSTANVINVVTLDRDTRNPILVGKVPAPGTDVLKFKKPIMIDQPAYGELEVAKTHMDELAERVFKPIRKTSFKTVGVTTIIDPLEFILVDGLPFRLISLTRNFNAESNDFSQDYEAEWLNG